MPPVLRASVGLHAAAAGLAFAAPQTLPWLVGGLVLNHVALTAAGLWPRSTWLGPNVRRLPAPAAERGEWALTLDDGPDPEVTPRVLDLLDAHGARASFFCIAERAQREPALLREIVARGHEVHNHSLRHRHHFSVLGPGALRHEIAQAQAVLCDLLGSRPTCFRAPAGLRNPFLDPVLHRLGLHLVSWTRRGFDTRERDPSRVLARLGRGLAGGDILLLHDGHAARDTAGQPVLLAVLPALLAEARRRGLRAVTLGASLPARGAA
jgi:peptidoglycan/xylan/chitin deacetylase (PgdA/CDA1 family)